MIKLPNGIDTIYVSSGRRYVAETRGGVITVTDAEDFAEIQKMIDRDAPMPAPTVEGELCSAALH